MDVFAELKLLGDGYAGGFSCGMTMHGSQTMERFSRKMGDENLTEGETVYESSEGLRLCVTKTVDGEAIRIGTKVTNESDREVTLEMLTSFALRNVPVTRVHRLQSFWSAEGKLRSETIKELHLEPSWNRCGLRCEKFGNVGSMPVRKYFPFLVLEDEKTGQFIGMQLYLASSWQMELICKIGRAHV